MMKHMPPLRSAWEREVSSLDLAEEPTLKRPKPKMIAFNTIRMSKLVKLSVSTSEVEDALANSSEVEHDIQIGRQAAMRCGFQLQGCIDF